MDKEINNSTNKMDTYFKYLEYLKDWANSHNEMGDYGMSPICFDEWYDNEYQYEDEE